jgi:hypothetical protein
MTIHGVWLAVLHEHSRATVIVTVPVPPDTPNDVVEFVRLA